MSSHLIKDKTTMALYRLIAVILTGGIMPLSSHAQTYSPHNAKVQLLSNEVLKGHLIGITPDSLSMEIGGVTIRTVHYGSVEYVWMYRQSGFKNGFLLGAFTGLAVGYGLNQASQFTTAAGAGFLGALGGACIGAFIGSQPKKLVIHGNRKKYDYLRTQCLMTL